MGKKKSVEILNEQIRQLDKQDNFDETITSTKEFKELEKIDNELEDNDFYNYTSNLSDVNIVDKTYSSRKVKKRNKGFGIIIGLLCGIFLVLFAIILIFRLSKDIKTDESYNDNVKYTEEQKEELINKFGKTLENIIDIHFAKWGVLLAYDDALKLMNFKDDINCEIHNIYKDGKVYLNKCSINGINNNYSYGVIQNDVVSEDNILKVYVEKESKKVTLNVPAGQVYDIFIVNCEGQYSEAEIFGDYVIYYDSEYHLHMKNYKKDEAILNNISYQEIWPIRINNTYDSTYILVKINGFWGVYNYITSEQVIAPMYTTFLPHLSGSIGNLKAVDTIGEKKIVAWDGEYYGVINYTTNRSVIPFQYLSISLYDDYIWAVDEDGVGHIYDDTGNKYLENQFDKIYGMVDGKNILVLDNGFIKLVQVNGKIKYDYGKIENIGDLNFGIYNDDKVLFQFVDKTTNDFCLEVSYDFQSNNGSVQKTLCGGLANYE